MNELYRDPITAIQDSIVGPPAVALPPANQPFGRILYVRNTRKFYMRVGRPAVSNAFWELMGGPGAALGWPKYVVNVAGEEPVTPYQSIQAAINDAVLDGHGFDNPTQVLVFPGTYIENVAAVIGIHIVGFEGCQPFDTVIQGELTIAPGAVVVSGSLRVANLVVRPTGKPGVSISGVGVASVLLSNCVLLGDGTPAVIDSNSNRDSSLALRECFLANTGAPLDAATGLLRATAAFLGALNADECEISVSANLEKAVQSDAGGGTNIQDSRVIGRILIDGGTAALIQRCFLRATDQAVVDLAGGIAGSDLRLLDSTVEHTTANAGPTVGGVGTALYGNVTWLNERRTTAAVVTTAVRQRGPLKLRAIGADTVSDQVEDAVVADTGGAGISYTFPPLGTVFEGDKTEVRVRSGAGGLTLIAAAGDTLDAGGPAIGVQAIGDHLAFIADPKNNNWVRLS